jgi:HD superfamily phosphohydrolase
MATKEIYDPIHEFITITPHMRCIIDTPEFQRLRELKQLGATYFVFPSATHSRFAHSLGVSYLAGKMMESLKKNQKELQITDRDIEITRIAGLIHDIGHGPFSHLYDNHIRYETEHAHEKRGCMLFRDMVKKYNLPFSAEETNDIIEMIDPGPNFQNNWKYQIIANKICQIDVDKLDYIRRDCYHLGIKITETFTRLITKVKVVNTPKGYRVLAWPKKLEYNIFSLFASRYRLHKQVYNHHAIKAHEFIIIDILRKLKNKMGGSCWKLTDSAVTCGLHKSHKDLLIKLQMRQIPKLLGEIVVKLPHDSYHPEDPNPCQILNMIIQTYKIGFASGNDNPLNQVYYFTQDNIDMGHTINSQNNSFCIPSHFQELIVRMYSESQNTTEVIQYWKQYIKKYA